MNTETALHDDETARDARLTAEALRVYRRYQRELVEDLSLCPYAAPAEAGGHVSTEVVLDRTLDPVRVCERIDALAARPTIELGLLLFPRIRVDRRTFERFVAEVRRVDTERSHPVLMVLADFHPEASVNTARPELLVPFLRRSPDPTIQVVRRSTLAEVRRCEGPGVHFVDLSTIDLSTFLDAPPAPEPLHARIAARNLATVERLGIARVAALFDDICADRERSYTALGER